MVTKSLAVITRAEGASGLSSDEKMLRNLQRSCSDVFLERAALAEVTSQKNLDRRVREDKICVKL